MKTLVLVLLSPIWVPCLGVAYAFGYSVMFIATLAYWLTTEQSWKRSWRVNSI